MQNFVRAAEEAKEVWDRRRNIEPSTSHHPVDFLDPETYPMTDEEETPQRNRDLRCASSRVYCERMRECSCLAHLHREIHAAAAD